MTKVQKPKIVFAVYHPIDGHEKNLRQLIAKHVPTLRRLKLVTQREAIIIKSKSGAYVEIFEWKSSKASNDAHDVSAVRKIWDEMRKVAHLTKLHSLPESKEMFSALCACSISSASAPFPPDLLKPDELCLSLKDVPSPAAPAVLPICFTTSWVACGEQRSS
jgi:hypothetical protein